MYFLLILLLISGCKTVKPVASEPEFMTYVQDNPHLWDAMDKYGLNERMLVKKVHYRSWNIEYAFAPSCSKRKQKKYRPKVVEAINRAVNLWLEPIRVMQKAIKDGRFNSDPVIDSSKQPLALVSLLNIQERAKVFSSKNPFQEAYTTYDPKTLDLKKLLNLPELSVVFNCRKGRAFMRRYHNSINIYPTILKTNIPGTKFSFEALLHEVGHTFGLADTYVDSKNKHRAHMVSTGIHPRTVGHQPISVMGPTRYLSFNSYQEVKPTVDDRNGIFWLYAHMYMNELELDGCPPHYQPETFARDEKGKSPTIACRSSRPFLFAMSSRNYSTAKFMLNNIKESKSIDINARSHEQGYTALHYAVLFAPIKLI